MDGQILNISPFVVWAIALSQLMTFGLTVWNMVSSGSRANARTLETHGEVLNTLENRLNAVEHAMREGPSRRDFHELEVRITKLQGEMEVLNERLKPIGAISERLQEIMLEQGRK